MQVQALGSYIGHRNRRRLLSTLREEFVEKKYQVFDIIGLLLILSQANLSSPVERVQKSWNFGSKPHNNIGAASVCNTVRDVEKLLEERILAGLCLCSSTDNDEGKT